MEERRFRNHYSVVFEKMGALVLLIVIVLINNINEFSELLEEFRKVGEKGLNLDGILSMALALGAVLLAAAVIIGVNSIIWSKTWITITESTIVMERNTMNCVKNTIGMKNISNVNVEQNLWEKILGTSKVKLDTNSLSTADSTDIKIVLKKQEAERIRALILERVNAAQGMKAETAEADGREAAATAEQSAMQPNNLYDVEATGKEIFLNGICSMNLVSLWIMMGCITGIAVGFTELRDAFSESTVSIFANLLLVSGVIVSCLKGLLGGFITYHDFKVGRREDKLYVHYGLFRTLDYTIPVSKINGVIIHQSLIGRILKKYMVKVVNVGMGDEETDAGSYIVLACDRAQLQEYLNLLLPEFAEIPIDAIKRQPRAIIWNKAIKTVCYSAVLVAATLIVRYYIPDLENWMCILAGTGVIGYGILLAILDYITAGTYFDEEQILTARGCFRRDITVMRYGNIEYFQLGTNILLKHFRITRGTAFLLAAAENQEQPIAACQQADLEPYIEKYCNRIL